MGQEAEDLQPVEVAKWSIRLGVQGQGLLAQCYWA